MIIGFANMILVSSKEFKKLQKGDEHIINFKRNGVDCFRGDFITIKEEIVGGLSNEKLDFEVVKTVYDSKTDMYTAKIRRCEGNLIVF